jgi:glycine/D-amino acid oxidase-like deaminating enzyme
MKDGFYRGGRAGVVMRSPDAHPVLGPLEGVGGLYTLTAGNGTSFKPSPAIGLCLSELITSGQCFVDVTAFRPARFAENQPRNGDHQYSTAAATVSR